MKILILKPSSLGDVVQALPVLRLLRCHFPGAEIYWWLDANLRDLLEGDPDLTGIIPFPRQALGSLRQSLELWRSVRWMRRAAFDWVIDLQALARSGLMAWLANGHLTVGLDDSREGARAFYDLAVARPSPLTHAVEWYLRVLDVLGVARDRPFEWLPARTAAAAAVHAKWQPQSERWVVLQPGARWLNKRWPAEFFVELVRRVAEEFPETRFVILGSQSDAPLGNQIIQAAPAGSLDLTGVTTLSEMIEWIRLSTLMVTNDTGPMHVGAALGKPVVALFGPTEPKRTGPYGQLDRVVQKRLPCAPCMKDYCTYEKPLECLRGIAPATVLNRVREHLRAPRRLEPDPP